MQQIEVSKLKPHPRNNEFFDDITGDQWNVFLKSIQTSGIVEPIIITQDNVIVSGHQRVRAAHILHIDKVPYGQRKYPNEDAVLKDLIETNIRQRGVGNPNPVKFGRCLDELDRISGVRKGSANERGNNRIGDRQIVGDQQTTQHDINDIAGISDKDGERYRKLAKAIPELEQAISNDTVPKTVALAIMRQLSEEEQIQLISSIPAGEKLTKRKVDQYIKQLSSAQNLVADYKKDNSQLQQRLDQVNVDNRKLRSENETLKQQRTETVIKEVQVENPETLKKIKELETELKAKKADNLKLADDLIEAHGKLSQAMGINTNFQLVSHCSEITLKMLTFVKEMSQYDYMSESFNEIPTATRSEYRRCVLSVYKWADRILNTINEKDKEYETQNVVIDVE